MSKNVIIDRSYAFYLVDYVVRLEGDAAGGRTRKLDGDDDALRALKTLNYALLLFDKVMLEDYVGSSFNHYMRGKDWLNDVFEVYSPDHAAMKDPDLGLVIEDSVRQDMEDPSIKDLVAAHFPPRYRNDDTFASLLWNVNRTLHTAKVMDATILPWPPKAHLYQHKFVQSLWTENNSAALSSIRTVFDIHLPSFDEDCLKDILTLRNDKRVKSLRSLIWKLSEQRDPADQQGVLRDLEAVKAELVRTLAPSGWTIARGLLSTPIPFPLNVAVQATYDILDLEGIEPYSWYFLLLDFEVDKGEKEM